VGALFDATANGPSGIALGRTIGGVGAVAMIVLQGKIIADFFTGKQFMIGISVSACAFPIGSAGADRVPRCPTRLAGRRRC